MTKTEFQREERYVVFKVSDLGNSLKGDEIRRLAREYAEQRRLKGKEPLECVVVEKDWPEYEPTWKAIEARVTGAQPAPSFADAYQGAMEEVAIWKKRALEIERLRAKIEQMEKQVPICRAEDLRHAEILLPSLGLMPEDKLYALPGAQPAPSEQDASVRKAWARFSHELHRSPDAPYPGMADAFEQHFSQSFIDREWRAEAATWAAAWKAAKRHCVEYASVGEIADAVVDLIVK